ncbi:MAG: OmpA family protein [Acidobacteria bacterium]|nr:OmpA family protein [Acidobacteriota bacterium]
MTNTILRSTSIAALALAPFITGCATKKYVKATVTPIEQRVGDLDGTTKAQAKSIEELERGVARADERAQGAQGKADSAATQAELARKEAAEGRTIAETGKSLAEKGLTRADQLGKDVTTINTRIENMQNYKMVSTDQVLFASGVSDLSKESMAMLDAAVNKVGSYKSFVVEVQGFTDSIGPKQLNIELSRKRADAVVRYLAVKHNMPLHRIFVAGLGNENQIADNKTRDGRKLNRRVELKVYVSGDQAPAQISSAITPTN